MMRRRVHLARALAAAAACLLAPAAPGAAIACNAETPIVSHFVADLAAWAESSAAIESYALECGESQLALRAVAADPATMTYRPALAVLADPHHFHGLAAYYNQVGEIEHSTGSAVWRGWKGRFAAVLARQDGSRVEVGSDSIRLSPDPSGTVTLELGFIDTHGRGMFDGIESRDLRYSHLWGWLRALSLLLEDVLTGLQKVTGLGWGLSIILLCAVIKVLLIPVSIFVARQQRRVGEIQSALEQPLREIRERYDGQEAHERIMAAHRSLGVSPFYTLRPMLGLFVQVPVLVAVFNMLGELPQLSGQAFWWISDLAYPDAILAFAEPGNAMPLFGHTLNLLPVLMTVVTIASAVIYRDTAAPAAETKKQKRNLYLMAIAFFILFYPFPASMVLYWATANVLQVFQQVVTRT